MIWNIRQNPGEAMRAYDPYCSLSGDMVVPLSAIPEMVEEIRKAAKERASLLEYLAISLTGNLHPIIFKTRRNGTDGGASMREALYDDLNFGSPAGPWRSGHE